METTKMISETTVTHFSGAWFADVITMSGRRLSYQAPFEKPEAARSFLARVMKEVESTDDLDFGTWYEIG